MSTVGQAKVNRRQAANRCFQSEWSGVTAGGPGNNNWEERKGRSRNFHPGSWGREEKMMTFSPDWELSRRVSLQAGGRKGQRLGLQQDSGNSRSLVAGGKL